MIRCILVDDEAYASKILADYIQKIPFLELVGTTTSPIEALSWVQEWHVDLVFLDIQMPELTGIQFMKICGGKCKYILTTAYPEYALDGFEHEVIDYLLKPTPFDRFFKAVHKAKATLQTKPLQIQETIDPSTPGNVPGYMFVKGENKNKFTKVNFSDILYIEGLKNYVSIYVHQQRLVTYQNLKDLKEQLPQPPFYRVHKSYIVSIDKVTVVDGNTIYIGDKSLPIGKTYRDNFLKMIREKEQW